MALSTLFFVFLQDILEILIDLGNTVIKLLTTGVDELMRNDAVQGYFGFLQLLASVMLVVGIGFAVSEWAINTNEGNGNSVLSTFKYMILGLAVTLGFTTIPVLLLRFTAECTSLLISGLTVDTISESLRSELTKNVTVGGNFLWPLFIIIYFVCLFKVFLGNLKRGGILIIQLTACPFYIFSIPRGYVDNFFSWCKQVIALYLTTFTQNFLLALGLMTFGNSKMTIGNLCMCMGILLASAEAPRILQQFGLDSSVRANPSQAIFAASGITNIVRTFVK